MSWWFGYWLFVVSLIFWLVCGIGLGLGILVLDLVWFGGLFVVLSGGFFGFLGFGVRFEFGGGRVDCLCVGV